MFRGRCSLAIERLDDQTIWWSQTGSNRRPHACKARALPAELWPRTRRRMLLRRWLRRNARRRPSGYAGHTSSRLRRGCATRSRRRSVVGLGRLELPTSRLSSARSNQLSYKPLTLFHQGSGVCPRATGSHRCIALAQAQSHKPSPGACSSAKKEKRRRRNPANGAQQS
jgi:hypothetical protein